MKLLASTVLIALALAVAGPAWAHDEISPATVPTGKPVFLTLTSANERSADLTSVTLTAPDGISLGPATRQSPAWTAQRSPTAITWTGGAVAPETFEQWGFEVEEVGQPGPLRWSVATGYANGTTDTHQVDVVAVSPGTEPATPATEPTAPASTTVTPAPTTVATSTTTSSGDGADGRATAALIVGIAAAVLAVTALVVAARARRRGGGPGQEPGSQTVDEGQDW